MATPRSEPADDSGPPHAGSKPADETCEVSPGVVREDSDVSDQPCLDQLVSQASWPACGDQQGFTREYSSLSDQQIAENFELPAAFRLINQPPLQGNAGICMACESARGMGLETKCVFCNMQGHGDVSVSHPAVGTGCVGVPLTVGWRLSMENQVICTAPPLPLPQATVAQME